MILSYQEMIDRATLCVDSYNRHWINYRLESMRNDFKETRKALVSRAFEKCELREARKAIGLSPAGHTFGEGAHCTFNGCLILCGTRKNPIASVRFYSNRRGYIHAFKIIVLGERERFYRIGVDAYIKTEDAYRRSYQDGATFL